MKMKHLLIPAYLLLSATVLAADPPPSPPRAQPRPPPCQGQAHQRDVWPNGTALWGTARKFAQDETSTVLATVNLESMKRDGAAIKGVRLLEGQLVAPPQAPKALVGTALQGADGDGRPVEVALCGAEPAASDPTMVWYRIELWDVESSTWKNPCIATTQVPSPRALAVQGLWDESGARHEVPGKFTFACENGAIAKCIDWGYKPWAQKDGQSLQELHQSCTRMVRADYCGNGRTHTREDTPIDLYDGLGILKRTTEASPEWTPEQASFEAAWSPEGASCLARRRDGLAAKTVLEECPDRFEVSAKDLGEGDRCTVRRKGAGADRALLRNHSYGKTPHASLP
jgi:hypothetical protein